jgi:hypothetical protein
MPALFIEGCHPFHSLILAIAKGLEVVLRSFHPEATHAAVLCLSNFCMPVAAGCGALLSRPAISAGSWGDYRNGATPSFKLLCARRERSTTAFRVVGAALLKRCSFVEDLVR